MAFPSTLWLAHDGRGNYLFKADRFFRACRTSILLSIVRIANPSQKLRRIASLVGLSFLLMWAALIGQRIHICLVNGCIIAASVGLSQLISQWSCQSQGRPKSHPFPYSILVFPADVISDLSLVILPIYFLRKMKIGHRRRIMIFSAFSASLLITVISIFHSVVLFTVESNGTVVIGHVKASHVRYVVCFLGVSRGSADKKPSWEQANFILQPLIYIF